VRLQAAQHAEPGGEHVEIRIGSLDEAPSELRPLVEIWVRRRESWILAGEGATRFDEDRR
jgi:hypothetical protein